MTKTRLVPYVLFIVVVPFALYVNLRIISKGIDRFYGPGRTDETLYETRLKPLKEQLHGNGVVGYITDRNADTQKRIKFFFLTQYSLCPLLVVEGKDYPLVIGGYYEIQNPDLSEAKGLSLVKDFGYGIRLYQGRKER